MARYGVSVELLKRFHKSETTDNEWLYDEAIEAAAQYLDNECYRRIELAGDTATARSYVPMPYDDALWIHDCTEITSVVENGRTLTANVDYYAHPLNGVTPAGETRPYYKLVRKSLPWFTDGAEPTVVVTAKWGWAAFPPGATFACLVAAKAYVESGDVRFGLAALSEAGGVSEREAKAVRDFVGNYAARGVGMVR